MVAPSTGSAQMQQPPLQVHLTPRLVSYYEVSILDPPVVVFLTTDTRTTATAVPSLLLETETDEFCDDDDADVAPCVAVGLATAQFPLYSHMPGWDSNSFGYHGDDGKIYHDDAGSGIRRNGPLFGAGDVVGCGIDYLARAIFFTLNGQFLGYAFEKLSLESLQQDYYPTVGLLNTNWPVQCNFGCEQPFVFDLTTIAAGQKETVFKDQLHLLPIVKRSQAQDIFVRSLRQYALGTENLEDNGQEFWVSEKLFAQLLEDIQGLEPS
jgi:hypothetical protein